jgi:uncharacterized protein (TIGR02266 family)
VICPACLQALPDGARFCGFCGFRLTPIPMAEYRSLSESIEPLEEAPMLLTQAKRRGVEGKAPAGGDAARRKAAEAPTVSTRVPSAGPPQPALEPPPSHAPARRPAPPAAARAPAQGQSGPRPGVLDDTLPRPPQPRLPPRPEPPAFQPPAFQPPAFQPPAAQPRPPAAQGAQGAGSAVRASRRFPLKVEVSYTSEHNFYTGFLTNLSSGGLFVATHNPSAIGDVIELTFTVPGLARSCTALCRVQWVREYNVLTPETQPGMGLRFVRLDPEARAAIEMFIRHREPIFFDND